MKQLWKQYSDRVDGATLRERVMIFAAAVVILVLLMNSLLIEPQLARQKQLSREIAQRQEGIQALQQQLAKMASERRANPDQADRLKLADARKRLGEVDARLVEEQRRFAPPEQIGSILEEMLSRNRKLKLVDMRTLPVAPLEAGADKPAAGAKPAAGSKPAEAKPAVAKPAGQSQIYRHGVELTVTGTYLDLLAYLKALERLPSQMYWGKLDLSVAAHPQVTLKLSVYTLSLDPAWMRV